MKMNSKVLSPSLFLPLLSGLFFVGPGFSSDTVVTGGAPNDYISVPNAQILQKQLQNEQELASDGKLDETAMLAYSAYMHGDTILTDVGQTAQSNVPMAEGIQLSPRPIPHPPIFKLSSLENDINIGAMDPSGQFAYVAAFNGTEVQKVNLRTGSVVATLTLPAGQNPDAIVVDPGGQFLYIVENNQLVKVQLPSFSQVAVLSAPLSPDGFAKAVIDPTGHYLYVEGTSSSSYNALITKVDLTSFSVAGTFAPTGMSEVYTNTNESGCVT